MSAVDERWLTAEAVEYLTKPRSYKWQPSWETVDYYRQQEEKRQLWLEQKRSDARQARLARRYRQERRCLIDHAWDIVIGTHGKGCVRGNLKMSIVLSLGLAAKSRLEGNTLFTNKEIGVLRKVFNLLCNGLDPERIF